MYEESTVERNCKESIASEINETIIDVKPKSINYGNAQLRSQSVKQTICESIKVSPESFTKGKVIPTGKQHPFFAASELCYSRHLPFAISPDDIWVMILQGLAMHINNNAEKYRKTFVDFEGKQEIIVRRDNFVKGRWDNNWEGVFNEFSEKISDYIGDNYETITADFSTTDNITKATADVVLMDVVSSYFKYTVMTKCCIPRFHIQGDTEDWEKIKARVEQLERYDLSWWTDHLLPTIEQFILATKGQGDIEFWENWHKRIGGSGTDQVTGHILSLFPYLDKEGKISRNTRMSAKNVRNGFGDCGGVDTDSFSSGFSKVPFIWDYYDVKYPMNFYAGFIGNSINDEKVIQAKMGWAIADAKG